MLACRWLVVLVVVSSVANTAGQQVSSPQDIRQAEAETILNAQTSLRRYLISSLTHVRSNIVHFQEFYSILGGIITDLQTRDLDPFKSLSDGNITQGHPPLSESIHNLQGRCRAPTRQEWDSLIRMIPASEPPDLQLTADNLQRIHRMDEPFVDSVLRGIQQEVIKPNSRLLGDVLYNFRFQHSPEVIVLLEDINQSLAGNLETFWDFHTECEHPRAILSEILNFLSRKKQSDETLVSQISCLLPAIADDSMRPPDLGGLFDVMLDDDYPPDIIQAKNAVAFAVRNEMNLSAGLYDPLEQLLMVVTKLRFLPKGEFWKEVRAIYPHVKMRYLAGKGQFFRPRSAIDVRFLLESFLTVSDVLVVEEVERVFVLSDWEVVLGSFDYSRYSRPRSLVLGMIEGLLTSQKLPLCSRIVLKYFMSNFGTIDVLHPTGNSPPVEQFSWGSHLSATARIPPQSSTAGQLAHITSSVTETNALESVTVVTLPGFQPSARMVVSLGESESLTQLPLQQTAEDQQPSSVTQTETEASSTTNTTQPSTNPTSTETTPAEDIMNTDTTPAEDIMNTDTTEWDILTSSSNQDLTSENRTTKIAEDAENPQQ